MLVPADTPNLHGIHHPGAVRNDLQQQRASSNDLNVSEGAATLGPQRTRSVSLLARGPGLTSTRSGSTWFGSTWS